MRLLVIGDIVGRAGRDSITAQLPTIREKMEIDFVVANGENATQGRGITLAHAHLLFQAGIDCLTLGDHAFDQRHLVKDINAESRIIRPLNFARGAPGQGSGIFSDAKGRKVLVISALGRVFMQPPYDDPFPMVDAKLNAYPLGSAVAATVIDFHAEATSEKCAMGLVFDGRATLIAGSHTHIPTADYRILDNGTAYITDLGMCGDYDSVIGVHKDEPINRFISGMRRGRFTPAVGTATICGVVVDTDETSGLAQRIDSVRIGGRLGVKP
ncbi:MAG: TIGR00282 family metallophosphoesterase [Rhodobacteraceae bacterium]|nr:TIGR00282 family metallophosphoesterase [Paracoccaceae bacterium]MCY4195537.1 TIGR00282 family metallophosphoesterase [Paracoccaceae bacterium]MCY4326546.1 TIGR00282 family metallophosphoesterase [Paracoccaceae bacterium]